MKLRLLISSLTAGFIALIFLPVAALASSAALYVSPASGTVTAGSIIPVQVRINTGGDPVNAVQANISYNPAQLAYQSLDATGSAFSLTANIQTGSGFVKMARATGGGEAPVKGDFLFVNVYFKALTTAGTSSVAIASDSHVVRSTDSVDIMAGAPAASGPKAPATGAPKPTAFASIEQAKSAVAALATPTPVGAPSPVTPMTEAEVIQAEQDETAGGLSAAKVLAWNSPLAWGGLAALLILAGAIIFFVRQRRRLTAGPAAAAAAPVATAPSNFQNTPHGSVDTKTGIINSETIYPSSNDSDNLNQGQR